MVKHFIGQIIAIMSAAFVVWFLLSTLAVGFFPSLAAHDWNLWYLFIK